MAPQLYWALRYRQNREQGQGNAGKSLLFESSQIIFAFGSLNKKVLQTAVGARVHGITAILDILQGRELG
jgi:hypothetical protein